MTEKVMDGAFKGKICERRINSQGRKSVWGPENSCWTDRPFNPKSHWKKESRIIEKPGAATKKTIAWKTSALENAVGSIMNSNKLFNLIFEM